MIEFDPHVFVDTLGFLAKGRLLKNSMDRAIYLKTQGEDIELL